MSNVQIYYLLPERLKKSLARMGIDLSMSVREGSLSINQLYTEISNNEEFCRDEKSINYKHFLSLIRDDITLYADLDGKVAGALSFAFNIKDGKNVIMFEGICSPEIYSGQGVGQELINTLIRIGKANDVKYIYLECKGSIMNYYRYKFGFEITSQRTSYDSDDSDDEDGGELYYNMRLDLSRVSGGKKKIKNKSFKRNITPLDI